MTMQWEIYIIQAATASPPLHVIGKLKQRTNMDRQKQNVMQKTKKHTT